MICVYGPVVYAQTWEILTLKNCIEPPFNDARSRNLYRVCDLLVEVHHT